MSAKKRQMLAFDIGEEDDEFMKSGSFKQEKEAQQEEG